MRINARFRLLSIILLIVLSVAKGSIDNILCDAAQNLLSSKQGGFNENAGRVLAAQKLKTKNLKLAQ